MIWMPGQSHKGPLPPSTSEESLLQGRMEKHVRMLAGDIGERNLWHPKGLEEAVDYIAQDFTTSGYAVSFQEIPVEGTPFGLPSSGVKIVKNIEAELRGQSLAAETVVVGGHYDSVLASPGANDNATGTAAVLEIARVLWGRKLARTVRFVAFVNEEPPFFRSNAMGSQVYASRAYERGEKIVAMISVETIGYYSEEENSQKYPFPLGLFYPSKGNFIAIVGNVTSRKLVRQSIASFRSHTPFPSEGAAAPGNMPGIGWSDHWSFWKKGYPALMVTDTALFRYGYYHTEQDTPDKIDYERMARVVAGLARVIVELAGRDGGP